MEAKFATKKLLGIFVLLLFLLLNTSLFSQNKSSIYLVFKENSKELCNVHLTRRGRLHVERDIVKYSKVEQKNGDINFDICGELFIYEKATLEKRIVCKNFLDGKKLTNYEELVDFLNKMQDKYPMGYAYPSKEYPKIYIPIYLPDSRICLYEVKWQYYIE